MPWIMLSSRCPNHPFNCYITNLPLRQIWVNPDCGLKTRRWEEVIPALKNMVEAAKILREEANANAK